MDNKNIKLQNLFKKFAKLLQEHDLDYLLEHIAKLDKKQKIMLEYQSEFNFIVENTCIEFGVNKRVLNSKCRNEEFEAKKCCFYLLNNLVGLKPAFIASKFKHTLPAITHCLKLVNEMDFERIPADMMFKRKMDNVIKKYREFLQIKK